MIQTLFVILLLIIGILLTLTSFTAYSRLTDKCTSKSLRTYLRWCIILGSILIMIGVTFFTCTNAYGCVRKFDIDATVKKYVLLSILLVMGIFIMVITGKIRNELKKDGCDVNIGFLTTSLWFLGSFQVAIPLLFIIGIFVKKREQVAKRSFGYSGHSSDCSDCSV